MTVKRMGKVIYKFGAVIFSKLLSQIMACSLVSPHISSLGFSEAQNAGRSGLPKIAHLKSSKSCTQRTPAGFPCGIPGIGLLMEGAIQHAPQFGLQFI